jgi:hypothetical protein
MYGLACLKLAAKYESQKPEDEVCSEEILKYGGISINLDYFAKCELFILVELEWELNRIMPIDIIIHFLA